MLLALELCMVYSICSDLSPQYWDPLQLPQPIEISMLC